ncbi:MAG: hypothetical protein ACSLE3_01405 [Microbacteriaceae bacterium]
MERIPERLHENTHRLRLYLDDVEELMETISRLSPRAMSVTIGRWNVQGVEELRALPNGVERELDISSVEPFIDVHLSKAGGYLSVADVDDLTNRGCAAEIQRLLRKRRDWWGTITEWGSMVLGPIVIILSLLRWASDGWTSAAILSLALALGLGLVVWSLMQVSRHNTIVLRCRAEREPWLKANADDLIKMALAAVVGWLLAKIR